MQCGSNERLIRQRRKMRCYVETESEKTQAIQIGIDAMNDALKSMNLILYIPLFLVVYYGIFFAVEWFENKRRCTRILFYENVLQLIDEEIEKMEQHENSQT